MSCWLLVVRHLVPSSRCGCGSVILGTTMRKAVRSSPSVRKAPNKQTARTFVAFSATFLPFSGDAAGTDLWQCQNHDAQRRPAIRERAIILKETMTIQKDAIISRDRLYRYSLERTWDASKERVLFIMLNPSTADAIKDDATIKKCVGFAQRWGFGGIIVGNLFALRSRNPDGLLGPHDPVGPKNDAYLEQLAAECPAVIAAWGNSGKRPGLRRLFQERQSFMKELLQGRMQSLGTNKDGTPKHPVLPAYRTPREPYGT